MGQLVYGVVGAVVGFYFGGPTGAQWGWAIGAGVGAVAGAEDIVGPRLQDLSVQSSTYGLPINLVYGTARISGNVIWSTELIEHTNKESAKGGASIISYSYTVSCAVGLCEGEIAGVQKIWANNDLIYDISPENTGNTGAGLYRIKVYNGTETQEPDPRMQAEIGAANTPAHRGLAYVVFEDFPLEKFGNRVPNFNFLVVRSGVDSRPPVTQLSTIDADIPVYDAYTDIVARLGLNGTTLQFYHVGSATDIGSVTLPSSCEHIVLGEPGTLWAIDQTGSAYIYGFSGMALLDTVAKPSWRLYGAWNPFDHSMVLAQSNLGLSVSVFKKGSGGWSYTSYSTVSSSSNVWGSCTTTHDGHVVLSNGDKICVLDSSYAVVIDYKCSPSAAEYLARSKYATYDSKRNLVYITAPNVSRLYVVDPANLTVTQHAVSAGQHIVYHEQADMLVGVGTGSNPTYKVFDLDNLPNTLDSFAVSSPAPYITGVPVEIDGMTDAILVGGTTGSSAAADGLFRVPFWTRLTASPYPLSTIIEEQCVRAGLSAPDVDVSALVDEVDGYVVAQQAAARANIEPLQIAYFFDAVESDDVLKFVKRGGSSAATIPEDDLGAYQYGADMPPLLDRVRVQEPELPRTVSVNYLNRNAEYQQGTQYDRRLTGSANIETTLSLPLALTDNKAAQIAAVNLYTAWSNRNRIKFKTSLKYTRFEPTDLLTVNRGNTSHTLRIVKKDEGGNGVIEWDAVSEDAAIYSLDAVGVSALSMPTQAIQTPVYTRLEMLDIPLLRDVDEGAGCYYAACGYRPGWDGMVLYKSADGGASWGQIAALSDEAVLGNAATALGDFFGGHVVDELNSVTVRLANTGLTLAGVSLANLLSGANACLLGDEVMGFRDATLNADGSYTLTGLLRGLRGTGWAMPTHAAGDRFVVFTSASARRLALDSSEIGLARVYKGVSIYTTLAQTREQDFTNTAIGLKPYAPAHLGGGRDASGIITINWVRCTRIGGEWRDYVDASQPEPALTFEIEFWTPDGATLRRTVTGITVETYTYTNATTDFPDYETCLVRVYQVSASVGRGYSVEATIDLFNVMTYFTDFSEYTTGVAPSDWTAGWTTGDVTYSVEETSGVKYLKVNKTATSRSLLSWDAVGTVANCEITAKIKAVGRSTTSSQYSMNGLALRAGGAAGSENAYRTALDRDLVGFQLTKLVSGSSTTLSTSVSDPVWTLTEWRWVKLQAFGQGVRARTWLDGEAEPSTWLVSVTDASLTSGVAGIWVFDSGNDMEVAEVTVRVFT